MATEAAQEGYPGEEPRNKRKRTALACSSCRSRKSRCDGRRPVCTLCSENNLECVWLRSAFGLSPPATAEYVAGLEKRLARLEQRMETGVTPLSASQSGYRVSGNPQISSQLTSTPVAPLAQNHAQAGIAEPAVLEDSIDGMGIVFTEETESGYFGPSSNIAFIHSIVRGLVCSRHTSSQDASPSMAEPPTMLPRSFQFSRPASPLQSTSAGRTSNLEIGLPPDKEIRPILQDYFSNTGRLFPFIDREAFTTTYNSLRKENFANVRKSWLGLLNIILALATSTSRDGVRSATSRTEQAENFYNRSQRLCDLQVLGTTSLEVVQYLLICALYLQGTQRSVHTWTVHGLAVKAAMQLGIHSPDTSQELDEIDREMRNRTWYACVLLDRTLSMTFGRPGTIPDYYIRLPLPKVLRDGIDGSDVQSVQFYSSTITLYKLLWEILDTQYDQNICFSGTEASFEIISSTFKLDSQLLRWKQEVQEPLTIMTLFSASGIDPQCKRLSVILSLRWLNIRILLHRQVLVRYLENLSSCPVTDSTSTFIGQAERDSLRIAIDSSITLIEIVHGALSSSRDGGHFLGAWWFTIYYVFNAGLIIIGVLIVQQSHEKFDRSLNLGPSGELGTALEKALEILGRVDRENTMANRCISYLRKLRNIISIPTIPVISNDQMDSVTGVPNTDGTYGLGSTSVPSNFEFGDILIGNDLNFLNGYFGHFENL